MITLNELSMSLELGLIYAIVAMGIYITFRIINISDLSCDGSFVLGAATSSALIKAGMNPALALLIAVLAGGASGSITGFLITRLKISDLLSGILVAFMLYSINLKVMGGLPNIALIGQATVFSFSPSLILLPAIVFIVFAFLGYMLYTHFGLAFRSIGQNPLLAKTMGVNVRLMTMIGLILSNALISLSGGLLSQSQGFADVGSGIGTVIIGLASVIIGERLLPFRSIGVKLIACVLGSIVYRLLMSVALHSEILGLETQDMNLITGLLVIAIMTFSRRRSECFA